MNLAVVVQRYGAELNGGAELHARYVAERLARHATVEVVTTCARDYISWKNELPEGDDEVHGLRVHRFPVTRARDPRVFARRSERVFHRSHSWHDELKWLDSEGPTSPALVRYLVDSSPRYDFIIFFSYRYYHAYHGIRAVASRAILVPTAERDPALGLAIFRPTFRAVRAIMYNSHEERALIQSVSSNHHVPGVVVGVGSEVPPRARPRRFRERYQIRQRFVLYVGRIDENKGCAELFDFFQRYATGTSRIDLVLVGAPVMEIPSHPRIRALGFISDEEKYDAIAAADVLIMPSYFESLSMVTLEAWAMRTPVLVNGRCDVLRGQTIRGRGGLYYTGYDEFAESLRLLESDHGLRQRLGQHGRAYFRRHYRWPVIEQKYLDTFARLQRDAPRPPHPPVDAGPGWFARRRRTLPPARDVVNRLPTGPVLPGDR